MELLYPIIPENPTHPQLRQNLQNVVCCTVSDTNCPVHGNDV
jgi:hypothetical protein